MITLVDAGPLYALINRREYYHIDALMTKYADVPMSFADACLVCIAEQHRAVQVWTTDSDFRIYRMHRNRRIRVLAPTP